MNEPDPALVWAARGGDVEAFGRLVRDYQADVWRFCMHILQNHSVADDATQECFVRAFRFMKTYKGRSKFSTWLLSIARNCAMDEMRRSGRKRRVEQELRATRSPGTEELATSLEIREALAELPAELREPVVLIDILGLSYAETAAVLGLASGTVKSRVHRARMVLADRLSDKEEEAAGES